MVHKQNANIIKTKCKKKVVQNTIAKRTQSKTNHNTNIMQMECKLGKLSAMGLQIEQKKEQTGKSKTADAFSIHMLKSSLTA